VAELEQTASFGLKMAPAEALGWVLPRLDADLTFRRWLDTEGIAFPGEPGRRCDTVAELVSESGKGPPWALVLELEARPRSRTLDRLLEYEVRVFRKLRHGPRRRDRYLVAGVVIVLTGRQPSLAVDMALPGTDLLFKWQALPFNVSQQPFQATMERIGRRELGRSVLIWGPLMAGANDPKAVEEWVRLAKEEPDLERQEDYVGLARVFAERAGVMPAWKKALEGWQVWQSEFIRQWKKEGREEGRKEGLKEGLKEGRDEGLKEGQLAARKNDLLEVLKVRFPEQPIDDIEEMVQKAESPEVLGHWFKAALKVESLDAFRKAARGQAGPPNGAPALPSPS
jgi:hypothetical protein